MISDSDLQEFRDYISYKHGKCKFEGCNFPAERKGDKCGMALHIDTSALESAIKERKQSMKNIEITPQQALGLAIITADCLNELDIITEDLTAFIKDKADDVESVFDSFYPGETISQEATELWVKELILKGIEACKN